MTGNAINILTKAVQYDQTGRKLEAFTLYEDGIRALLETCKCEQDPTRKLHFQNKIKEYIGRAEQIKQTIQKNSTIGEVIAMMPIAEGSTGHSYKSLFGKYLDDTIQEVAIEEPYIREHYQFVNLIIFLELIVKKCRTIKFIKVKTTLYPKRQEEQNRNFDFIRNDLDRRGISLSFEIDENLHDRQIILSNGYIIKIGRGLHFFKAPITKYSLGIMDHDFRECMETKVDIFKCQQ